jgi:ParB family chromosome partitioning protein
MLNQEIEMSTQKERTQSKLDAIKQDTNVTARPSTKTAMNTLMDFTGELKETKKKLRDAEVIAEKFKGSILTIKVDPKLVDVSEYANRAEESFHSPEYESLKKQIELTKGNEQPVKVRPKGAGRYELVYGHRRHRACLELGFEVLSIVEEMDDKGLWLSMTRENEDREDLSPYEKAKHYERAIKHGIYKNWSAIADELGIVKQAMSPYKALAELPLNIIDVLKSTLELNTAHVPHLTNLTTEQGRVVAGFNDKKVHVNELLAALSTQNEKKSRRLDFSFGAATITDKHVKLTLDIEKFGSDNVDRLMKHIKTYQKAE